MSIYKMNQTHSKASPLLYNNSVFYNFNFGTSFQALIETFYVSGNRTLPPLLKIMQSFILVQNTLKNNLIHGGEIFGAPFSRECPFWPISNTTLMLQIGPCFFSNMQKEKASGTTLSILH